MSEQKAYGYYDKDGRLIYVTNSTEALEQRITALECERKRHALSIDILSKNLAELHEAISGTQSIREFDPEITEFERLTGLILKAANGEAENYAIGNQMTKPMAKAVARLLLRERGNLPPTSAA